jgi:hypothetical protein
MVIEMPTVYSLNGEVGIHFQELISGRHSFASLGFKPERLKFGGGDVNITITFDELDGTFYEMPLVHIKFGKVMPETLWRCEFNGEVLFEQAAPSYDSTTILFTPEMLTMLLSPMRNTLVLTAGFAEPVEVLAGASWLKLA